MLAEKAQSLLSFYQSTVGSGFSSTILKHSRVVSAGEDHRRVVVEFVVPILPDFSNISGAMHGGAIATIVDELTGVAVWLADHEPRHMATTNLSLFSGFIAFAECRFSVIPLSNGFISISRTSIFFT